MTDDLMDEIRRQVKRTCDHVCHKRGLNPWVESCPTCGCENPKYDPEAVSDIDMNQFTDPFSVLFGKW